MGGLVVASRSSSGRGVPEVTHLRFRLIKWWRARKGPSTKISALRAPPDDFSVDADVGLRSAVERVEPRPAVEGVLSLTPLHDVIAGVVSLSDDVTALAAGEEVVANEAEDLVLA